MHGILTQNENKIGTKGLARSVKFLSCKPENLILEPWHSHKKLSALTPDCNPSLGRERWEVPGAHKSVSLAEWECSKLSKTLPQKIN